MKLVSVIIPAYKVEQYIAAAVESVLKQTYPHFELLIIDDGSPDRTVEICQQFTNPKIQIIRQQNRGSAGARNTGIRYARGEYIAFLDGDDLWLPEKLSKQVEHLDNSPSTGISFNRSAFIDEAGEYLGIYQMPRLENIEPFYCLCRNPISNGSTPVIRREVLEAVKYSDNCYGSLEDFYFDEQFQSHNEDVELWLRIVLTTPWKLEGIPETLTLYRVNPAGSSTKVSNQLESLEKMLLKTSSYAPNFVSQWRNAVRAYELRYLARRMVVQQEGQAAVKLVHQAIATYWQILIEEPRRTGLTLAAAYSLYLLPQSFYRTLERIAMKLIGNSQIRSRQQDLKKSPIK